MADSRLVRHLRFRELAYLVSLGETRSIHRTAAQHNVSQPALSKALVEIEASFGLRLFDRSRKGVRPTRWGAMVVDAATQIVASLNALDSSLELERQGKNRIYRVGATPNPALRLIPEAYRIVREQFADFVLELVEDSTDRLLEDVRLGRYSLVVGRSSPQNDFSVLRQMPLYPESGIIVARPGHPMAPRARVALASLLPFPWILPQPGPTRSAIELSFMRARCNPPTPAFINYSIRIVCDLLARSDALSVLPRGPAEPFLSDGTIMRIASAAEFHLPSYSIYVPRHAALDPRLACLERSILHVAGSSEARGAAFRDPGAAPLKSGTHGRRNLSKR